MTDDPIELLSASFHDLFTVLTRVRDPAARDARIAECLIRAEAMESPEAHAWGVFLRERRARITKGGHRGLLQLAYGHATTSVVSLAVERWLARTTLEEPWLLRLARPMDPEPEAPSEVPPGDGSAAITALQFRAKGRGLVSIDGAGVLRAWRDDWAEWLTEIETHVPSARVLAVSSDGERVMLVRPTGEVVVWHLATRTWLVPVVTNPSMRVQFTGDGAHVCIGLPEGLIEVWGTQRWRVEAALDLGADPVRSWLAGEGGSIVLLTDDGRVRGVSVNERDPVHESPLDPAFLEGTTLATHGLLLAAGGADGSVRWMDVETGELVVGRGEHDGAVTSMAVRRGSPFIVTAGDDATMRLWEVESGDCLARWHHDAAVTAVALGAQNRIALGDGLGRIRMFS